MGSMIEVLSFDDSAEFFAPVSSDLIDSLIGQHHSMRQRIEELYAVVTGETAGAMAYVLEGNRSQDRYPPSVDSLFCDKGKVNAIANLDASYWSKAMHMTDVLNAMPQKRRDEWHKSIQEMTCPAFEEDTVRSTFTGLLAMRSQFLAERVDGIFRGLSGEHVTNSPAAFGKRMIVSGVLSEYGYSGQSACGLINDLRCVIAKFMGRDEPGYNASSGLVSSLKGNWGQWVKVDGGALKIRLYMKGTAHIEVHPDMAWRLNSTLAHMHPMAIPPEFRTKPKKKAKEIELIQRPLPFAVIELLAAMKQAARSIKQEGNWQRPYRQENVRNALKYDHYGKPDKHVLTEVCAVLESIGGVLSTEGWWQFDYDAHDVIRDIVASGCIPDQKAHQFYPTPANLAQRVVDLAEIEPQHECLEPSAGTGAIADLMPMDQTRCIEVSKLRCDVLTAKGHDAVCMDFAAWAESVSNQFDRICMNPPFDRGQWQAHITHAASLLSAGGRLVAILPSSAKGKDVLPGLAHQWHGPFDNQFAGASVSVVILVADKKVNS